MRVRGGMHDSAANCRATVTADDLDPLPCPMSSLDLSELGNVRNRPLAFLGTASLSLEERVSLSLEEPRLSRSTSHG